jgi:hypothetical protein
MLEKQDPLAFFMVLVFYAHSSKHKINHRQIRSAKPQPAI